MTDIHLRVSQFSGDLMAFNDEGEEITRCVVEEWIENNDDNFNENVTALLRAETREPERRCRRLWHYGSLTAWF